MIDTTILNEILPLVQKPARYTGGEYGETVKPGAALRVALCFPDLYEIGMSNLGCRILYGSGNAEDGIAVERVFAPDKDFREQMTKNGVPLYTLETKTPVSECDIAAFSLGYEMCFTTVLDMLHLAGLPLYSEQRDSLTPLVVGGGVCCYNPEPIADFFDLFIIGEGEEVNTEVYRLLERHRNAGGSKSAFLLEAAKIPGVYVPSRYETAYNANGTVAAISPRDDAPATVTKRIVRDFDSAYFPTASPVPSTEITHDRVSVELFRGCIHGCRFCQAGYAYRPLREKSAKTLIRQGKAAIAHSGCEELGLLSLSSSDYTELAALCDGLLPELSQKGASLSLPSLRVDRFSLELMRRALGLRKPGLTFAPEAGSQRLRDVINKKITEEDILNGLSSAFSGGWNTVKLYFMLGLPGETDEDVLAIAELTRKIYWTWKSAATDKKRPPRITVSTSFFVPKPHTAFQWAGQITPEEYMRRVSLLREELHIKNVVYNWHDAENSVIEALLARGDRRLSPVLERVWRDGGNLEGWSENFSFERWQNAMTDSGLELSFYTERQRGKDEILPWQTISIGVDASFLLKEAVRAETAATTPNCRESCSACGAAELCAENSVCPKITAGGAANA
ncbi:MAG: TIGR03960 family B12-binding radical SAM protein [Oscillospiraceae bacterium]|nr:TIGR03960 family B12-binding radical SAM protein [Oscillospiraceae bacterium]